MTTREAAMEALFSALKGAYAFGAATRRVDSPNSLASPGSAPGLGLIVHSESYSRPSPNVPPKRKMMVKAIVYIDAGGEPNVIPDAVLNPIKDAFDAALAPDNLITGNCTLGGVVYSAIIDGEVIQAPGDATGKGLAVMPIELLLP